MPFHSGRQADSPGQFARPKGISTDKEGNIYVIDTAFGNVQIFDAKGQLLMFLGERGQAGNAREITCFLPAFDIDTDGRIYVVDQFFRKIDIFRPIGLDPEADLEALGKSDTLAGEM